MAPWQAIHEPACRIDDRYGEKDFPLGLQLAHSENIFSIEFSALTYLNPGTNRYRFKLDAIDRDWRGVGSDERLATYTTLPAATIPFGFRRLPAEVHGRLR